MIKRFLAIIQNIVSRKKPKYRIVIVSSRKKRIAQGWSWFTLLTWLTLLILFILFKLLYTAFNQYHVCLYILLGMVKRYWNGLMHFYAKSGSGWMDGYPLDCYDY